MYSKKYCSLLSIIILVWVFNPYVIHGQANQKYRKLTIDGRVSIMAEIAYTLQEKKQGLSHRKNISEKKGLLFYYTKKDERIFWMKNMQFAIDIIWIADKKILHIEKSVPPPPFLLKDEYLHLYGKGIQADKVLEVRAGFVDKHAIKKNMSIRLD